MAASTFGGTLRMGLMNSERVRAVQKTLNATIKCGLDPDADFGALTYDCVRSYQRAMGLPITGEVDRMTWDSLMGPVTISPINRTAEPAQDTPIWVWGLIAIGVFWYVQYGRK